MDLADTTCTIQYINNEVQMSYLVPFFDIMTYKQEKKILIPWQISDMVTQNSGNVTFSLRFFKLDDFDKSIYELNTLPATSKILKGIDFNGEDYDDEYKDADIITKLQRRIDVLSNQIGIYWNEV